MKKYVAWLITHSLFSVMLVSILWDPNHLRWQFKYSAYSAVGFLCLILSLNPLKAMFPRWILIHRLNRYRQEIGVSVFSYAVIHALCFAIGSGSISRWLSAANNPQFMSVMLVSMPIFCILAITSTQFSKIKLGFKNWKRLHRLVYLAEAGVIVHLGMNGKSMLALMVFLPLVLVQLFRVANRDNLQ
jgi:methionine sulfoxide reductase heme-binding subunit